MSTITRKFRTAARVSVQVGGRSGEVMRSVPVEADGNFQVALDTAGVSRLTVTGVHRDEASPATHLVRGDTARMDVRLAPPALNEDSAEVEVRGTLHPQSQRITSEPDIRLSYTDSLVTGTVRANGRSIPIRANVNGPVLFEGYSFHHPLTTLAAMPLEPGFVASLDVFTLPQSTKTMRYRVTGTEPVETPAGTFETYVVRFRARGGGSTGTAYLRREAPHHLIRLTADQEGGDTFTQELESISEPSDQG